MTRYAPLLLLLPLVSQCQAEPILLVGTTADSYATSNYDPPGPGTPLNAFVGPFSVVDGSMTITTCSGCDGSAQSGGVATVNYGQASVTEETALKDSNLINDAGHVSLSSDINFGASWDDFFTVHGIGPVDIAITGTDLASSHLSSGSTDSFEQNVYLPSTNTTLTVGANQTATTTFMATPGNTYELLGIVQTTLSAGGFPANNGSNYGQLDSSLTDAFEATVDVLTPGATINFESGHDYSSTVPEPSTSALIGMAFVVAGLIANGRRS